MPTRRELFASLAALVVAPCVPTPAPIPRSFTLDLEADIARALIQRRILRTFAEYERALIEQRVTARLAALRAQGRTVRQIADALNRDAVR